MRWPHTLLCVVAVGSVVERCVADAPIAVLAGFVRASTKLSDAGVSVDYTQNEIKIQLLNALDDGSAGHVRDSSRVRPNGGYMVPVYDQGKYVLRVSLEGWSFAPDQLLIDVTNLAGGDDSKFKNLNFEFTGFSVSGHVSGSSKPSCKDPSAPQGVVLSLVKGDSEVGSTKTDVSGKFTFENIPPGKYSVSASSDEFKLEGSIQDVEVSGPNTKLSKAIHVVGYSLSGSVLAGAAAVEGVKVFLYSDDEAVTCENQSDDLGVLPERASKPSCLATSSKSGEFSFQYLACGRYTLVPHYKEQFTEGSADSVTSFDVTPQELKVNLGHKSLNLLEKFQVVGFSASGRVVDENGAGVSDAQVFIDGKQKAVTNDQGYYNLAGMTTGAYNIEAKKQHMVFAPLTNVELTPQSGVATDVRLSAYSVCGSVHSAESLGNREIKLSPKVGKGKSQTAKTDAKGAYCFDAAPGDYIVNAVVTPAEETLGMLLSPTNQPVKVAGKPVHDVDFSQAKVSIAGSVKCVAGCPSDVPVLLRNTRTEKITRQTVDPASGTFAFNDVLPGKYVVSMNYERFCWEKSSHNVQVNLEDATGIKFSQTGFLMNVESQVPITLRTSLIPAHSYANVKQDSKHIGDHQIVKGQNAICLPSQGQYRLEPISCYRFTGFEGGMDTFDTDKLPHKSVQLKVTHYQMSGSIEVKSSTPFSGQLALSIVSPKRTSSDNVVYAQKSGKSPKEGVDLYEFQFWAEEHEEIELVPHVSDPNDKSGLLFYPRKLAVRVSNRLNCQASLRSFEARKGIYVTGRVKPAVEDVQITVDYLSGKTPSTVVKTDKKGKYVAGPLYDDVSYQISALKSGYHLKQDKILGSFTAMELGKIEVRVLASGDSPVEGALISLSGSGETPLSANEQTDKDGILRFTDLTPGTYFLQPFFKEYEFEPNFDQIEIESGTSAVQKFDAKRVAYSAFGSVRSLNGKAERGAKVHATAYSEDRKQVIHHEEGTVEESGEFRIRGLNPSFEYKINVDTGGAANRIARASPEEVTIQVEEKDHLGLEFVAFRHLNKFDVSGHVENFQRKPPHPVKVTLSSKHLKETVTISELNYFEFSSLPANDIYQVSYSRGADTPHGRIDNRKLDTIDLTEHAHIPVRVPKLTTETHDDLSGGGLIGLIFFTLGAVVFFNRSSVLRVYSDFSDARGYEDHQTASSPATSTSLKKRRSKARRT